MAKRVAAPKAAETDVVVQDPEDLESFDEIQDSIVEDEELSQGLPLIRGARVVFIGAKKNMSVSMIGRILDEAVFSDELVEMTTDPEGNEVPVLDANGNAKPLRIDTLKTCIMDGVQSYDFSTHDNKGRPIKQHRLPMDAPENVRGRRYAVVEHPDHLRHFQRRVDGNNTKEFVVMVPKKYRRSYEDYVAQKDSQQGRRDVLLKRTIEE